MVKCCVYLCSSATYRKEPGITFHRFPKDKITYEGWLKKLNLESWTPNASSVVCSLHFKGNLIKRKNMRTQIVRGALPTVSEEDSDSNEPKIDLENNGRYSLNGVKRHLKETVLPPKRLGTLKRQHIYTLDSAIQSNVSQTSAVLDKPKAWECGISEPKIEIDLYPLQTCHEVVDEPNPEHWVTTKGSSSAVFHCKICLKNITTSFRYRCLVCPDYEMCGECERRGGHHDDHYVLRVPMQRPTVEVDQVESAVRRALSSFSKWKKAFKSSAESKVGKKKQLKKTGKKPDKTWDSGDSMDETGNDSEDTEDEPINTEKKPEETLHEPGTPEPEVASPDDEPEVKMELVIKEEEDPLEEVAAASAFLQNMSERQNTRGSKDVPSTQLVPQPSKYVPPSQAIPSSRRVPLTQDVPPPKGVPPFKRRRDDDHHFTTTTHSHRTTPITKEPTALCTETSSSSTVATSSTSGSKVDVFVLKRTRPVDENDD